MILANTTKPEELKLKDISSKYLDKKIQTRGEIIKIRNYKESNFQVITIADKTYKIDATLNNIQNLSTNQSVTIIGTIRKYKNNLQIQADKIILN